MLQTFFDYPVDCRYTWFSNDGVTRRVRDYVLTEEFVQKYTYDCSVDDRTELNTPWSKRARWKRQTTDNRAQDHACSLGMTDLQNKFKDCVTTSFVDSGDRRASAISENMIYNLCDSANKVLPKKTRHQYHELWKENEKFNRIIHERSQLQKNSDDYKSITKKLRTKIRFLRNEKLHQEANEINMWAQKREIEALFRSFDPTLHGGP